MFCGIVDLGNSGLKDECLNVLSSFDTIRIKTVDGYNNDKDICSGDLLFLITDDLDRANGVVRSFKDKKLPQRFPIIFYNSSLMLSSELDWHQQKNLYFVVGEERKEHLKNLIERLLKNHWRRIPYKKMGIDFQKLSPRMKKVMEFIETNDLQSCDIFHIADYLNITPGYFSQLFKNETGQTFRGFMQKVLNYYENLLFLDWKLDVKSVSRLLGYSELSSYSRSFKNRKGQSPRAFAKLNVQP